MTANAKSKFYGDANPDARRGGDWPRSELRDALNYTLTTTALATIGVGPYPIAVTLGRESELRRDPDRRGADGEPEGRRR